jgi:hypothetical protein
MSTELTETNSLPAEMMAYAQIIEKAAANPEVDVSKLEKLLDMQERVLRRRAEIAFNVAFAEMQSQLPIIQQNGQIIVQGVVRSKYALFEDINEAVKPILKANGFALTFKTHTSKGEAIVVGILMHKDGHREETDITLEADTSGSKNSVQSIGSSISYAKRYCLCALLNITSRGEDDDGSRGNVKRISESQAADIQALMDEVKANKEQFLKYFKIDKLSDLPQVKYPDAVKALEKKRKAAA